MIKKYQDLIVWQKSMQAAETIYKLVKKLPKEELYSLSDQMRRAAISIPSNIAEGYGRNSTGEYKRFLTIANGSKTELETQLILASRIGYFTKEEIKPVLTLLDEIGGMIYSLHKKIGESK